MTFLCKNLAYLVDRDDVAHGTLAKVAGIQQPTVGRIISGKTPNPGYQTVMAFADYFGVKVDDLVNRDLAVDGPAVQSQAVELDPEIMSSALVHLDKAMKHFKVDRARLHELPSVLIYAYRHRKQQPKTMSKEQYKLFDESVLAMMKGELSDLPGRTATAGSSRKKRTG